MPTLQEQAIRLRRTKWSNAWMLADELYLMLMSMDVATTGPTTVNITNAGQDPFVIGPFPDLNLPRVDLNFPEFDFTPVQSDQSDVDPDQPRNKTETIVMRLMLPGQIVAVGGDIATVTIYPNGLMILPGASPFSVTNPEIIITESVSASLLDTTNPPLAGEWVSVYRVSVYEVSTTTIGGRTNTQVRLLDREHNVLPAGGGGKAAAFAGKITDGGPGDTYKVSLYKKGLALPPTEVEAKQLQIDENERIPVDTWAIVLEGRPQVKDADDNITDQGEYLMQVPVWL